MNIPEPHITELIRKIKLEEQIKKPDILKLIDPSLNLDNDDNLKQILYELRQRKVEKIRKQ